MSVTDIRVKLVRGSAPLLAYCRFVVGGKFVVTSARVIGLGDGRAIVSMPARRLTDHCPGCGGENCLKSRFCNWCGAGLAEAPPRLDARGKPTLYQDLVFPACKAVREELTARVVAAYEAELAASRLPGYECSYDATRGETT